MSNPIIKIEELAIPIKDADGKFVFATLDQLHTHTAAPQKPVAQTSKDPRSTAKARFYIDSSDEQEVAGLNVPENAVPTQKLEEAASLLISSLNLQLTADQEAKLAKILLSLLKDIRNPRKTREVLMREEALGGMGLSELQAKELIEKTLSKKQEIFNKIKGDTLEKSLQTEPAEPQVLDMYEDSTPAVRRDTLLTEVKQRPQQMPSMPVQMPAYTPTKTRSQPVGPVEEIKLLTLADFRHLGKSATESAQRVFQKIDLLADESLELKAQAIKSWKASPAYQDYLAVGHQSIESHESVEAVIKAKQVNDITLDEFHAIADLNKSLQF